MDYTQPTPEQIQEWKDKYKRVVALTAEDEDTGEKIQVIVRKPSRTSFERYQEEIIKKGSKAMKQFVLEAVLLPEREELTRILDNKPGFVSGIADPLQTMMGVGVNFTISEF